MSSMQRSAHGRDLDEVCCMQIKMNVVMYDISESLAKRADCNSNSNQYRMMLLAIGCAVCARSQICYPVQHHHALSILHAA